MSSQPARIHQIDGLRAIASILVVIHHSGLAALGTKIIDSGNIFWGQFLYTIGSSGVEMFFLLSGVVLLRGYLRKGRKMDAILYVKRRVERLWPPYLVAWLFAGPVILLTSMHPPWWVENANLPDFNLVSWFSQIGIIYFGSSSFNFAWWSLTIEIVFYLLVPVIIWGRRILESFNGNGDWVLFFLSILVGVSWNFMNTDFLPMTIAYLFQYGISFMGYLAKRDLTARQSGLPSLPVLSCFWLHLPSLNQYQCCLGLFYFGVVALVSKP